MNFEFISILILSLGVVFLYFYLLKSTVFGLDIKRTNYIGFFFGLKLLFYLLPGIILLNYYSVDTFFALFKVKQDSVYWISLIVLYTFYALIISLSFLSRYFKKYLIIEKSYKIELSQKETNNIIAFTRFVVLFCFALLVIVLITTGAKHAFLQALTGDVSLSIIRAANKSIGIAKLLNHLFIFIGPLIAILAASVVYNNRKMERYLLFISAIIISTYMGSKGPLMVTILAYTISYMFFNKKKISLKIFIYILLFIIILFYFLFQVVTLQYANIDFNKFVIYFINRIFIASIDGVYEQFNLFLSDWSYWIHSIPFISTFVEHPVFHKDLMMISEDRIDPSSIGIKNTLFIAEAYAFGGWPMVIVSPFIWSLNIALTFWWFNFLFQKVLYSKIYTKYIVGLFVFSYISLTGGYSDLVFFKLIIMMTIFILGFIIPFKILKLFIAILKQIQTKKV